MKKRLPGNILIISGLLLTLLYLMPLWQITLVAPQYPDGVKMHIYINKIGGSEPGTLQNVNILNHYIGMKPIEPESIPELQFLPLVIGVYIGLALIAGISNNRYLIIGWTILFTLGCIAGLYDFYLWEYDYGHNLADNAPMKFEGESFQPPLIGNKNLLNFVAKSWPHYGGVASMLSLLLAVLASYLKLKRYA